LDVDGTSTADASEQIIREHAALRRVAVLVARQPSPSEVFAAVTEEAGRLLGAQTTNLMRVERPDQAVIVAGWSEGAAHVPVGSTGLLDGRGLVGQILNTGGPSRVEDFEQVGGAVAAAMRSLGLRSGVAGPVVVGGRIWGALVACSAREVPLPPGTEDRIAAFAQLVSLAIENTESREELAASRARIVKAADEARRRIERDLHDGAQVTIADDGIGAPTPAMAQAPRALRPGSRGRRAPRGGEPTGGGTRLRVERTCWLHSTTTDRSADGPPGREVWQPTPRGSGATARPG
jgi:GAF domain-containing protein